MDLDEVADRLYALPPSEFTAARTAQARAAKDAGDARLSREIARLRKPTVSAWAVNRLAREHPGELAELLDVGERLRAAWQEQDADALAELTRRRGEVAARAGRLARQEGELSAAAGTEVDQTLDAALVDAAAAAEVRQGRLVKPLQYSGFAPAPIPREPVSRRKRSTQEKAGDEAARARAQEEAEARKARERQEAEAAHREWLQELRTARQEHDERAEKVARLEKKLAKARKRLEEARQRLEVTQREERHARQRLER
ncbi:vacuolar-type H+-ATPase subunit I/STV1 [Nonomuraea thailandensis]|uniref:Vacuolar-type H+-ATPase subunit I/STV1 n=1 Tax=Nonomuraea thailandensis TaxID=1188745 RepID=A0A9X2GCM1_9ACTN|nr:hypothetical protein [Nonomuraea thailandensis]MCP2355212.1 vacuolar-type H+-ATPase subunit I/STV1 [Nonomuraea thailandensis]